MSENIRERFIVSYERGAAASFLTLKAGISEKVMNYQVEMIAGNRIPHILPFDMRRENDEINFNYNITSMLPLTQFLKRKISRNEFLKIFADITKVILDSQNYFLCDSSIILNTDYIYINPATGDISVVYIPVMFDADIGNEFRQFIMHVIISSTDIDEGSGDNFLQRILGYAKSETFNMLDFNKLVMDLLAGSEVRRDMLTGELVHNEDIGDQYTRRKRIFSEEMVEDKRAVNELMSDSNSPKGSVSRDEKEGKPFRVSKNVFFAIAVQIILVAIFMAVKDYLKSLNEDPTVTYGAAVLIMAAIDVLAFKKLFGKGDIIIKMKDGAAQEENKKTSSEFEGYLDEDISLNTVKRGFAEVMPYSGEFPGSEAGGMAVSADHSCDTVILGVHDAKCPFLKGTGTSAGEIILITKPEFILGRLDSHVDYVIRSSAVGKVHAQIIIREGSYFIKDLNSRNGTCINDIRIDSNEEYEIENNDRISLANNDYIFVNT